MKSRISGEKIREHYKKYMKNVKEYTYLDDFVQLHFIQRARITDDEFDKVIEFLNESDFEWFTKDEWSFDDKRKFLRLLNKLKIQ